MVTLTKTLVWIYIKIFYRVKLINKRVIPEKGPVLICANHPGKLDMFLIGCRLKRLARYMAKEELFRNPVLRFILNHVGAFPVRRGRADIRSVKKAINLLKEGHIVAMFPEGTRTRNKDKSRIRIGGGAALMAVKASVPIIPVAVSENYRIFGKIKVIYGEPFYLDADKNKKYSSRELKQMSSEIMKKVYNLFGG